MKFEYIREFVTAAKSVELQKAAAALNISPSVLTKHMTALECEIGASLFLRKRKTELSRFGEIFLPYAKQLSDLQDEYLLDFTDSLPAPSGSLKIGISPEQNKDLAKKIIDGFAERYPSVLLEHLYTDEGDLCGKVRDRECELAVIEHTDHRDPGEGLIFLPFCSYRLMAIFLRTHPLAGTSDIDLQQLRYIKSVMDSKCMAVGKTVIHKCRALGFEPEITYCDTFGTFEKVKQGEYILLQPISPGLIGSDSTFASVPVSPEIIIKLDLVLRREALKEPAWAFIKYAAESK